MLIMMPSNKVATHNAVELAFGSTANGNLIRVFVRAFYEEFSTEASNYSSGVDCCAQALIIMVKTYLEFIILLV